MPDSKNSTRSQLCNGPLIAKLRRQAGWTQKDLAAKAGFAVRVIVKAEAGQSVAPSSVHIIAEALTEGGVPTTPAQLVADPVSLAREFMGAFYEYESKVFEACKHFLSPNLMLHFAGDPNDFPFAGTHVGLDAATIAFEHFFRLIEFPEGRDEAESFEFIATDDGALMWGESWGHPIGMPIPAPVKLAVRMDFQDGLMTVWDNRFDTKAGAAYLAENRARHSRSKPPS